MSGYIGASPVPQATQHREAFTATASQTSFPTVGYTPQFVDVYLNGVKLAAADYTATNGSDIVLTTGAALDDILEYVAYTPFEVADQTFTGTTTVDVLSVTGTVTAADLTLEDATPVILLSDTDGPNQFTQILEGGGNTYYISRNDASNGQHIFQQVASGVYTEAMRINTSGNVQMTGSVTAPNFIGSESNPSITSIDADGYLGISGDSLVTTGGNIRLFSAAHATNANNILFRTNDVAALKYDSSASLWKFQANDITTTGTIETTGGIYLGGSVAANLLDDYEEGTWTPTLIDGTLTDDATYTTQVASYTKIGNMVHIQGRIITSALGTLSGSLLMSGLPFTSTSTSNDYSTLHVGFANGLAIPAGTSLSGHIATASTSVALNVWSSGQGTASLTTTTFSSNGQLIFSGSYKTDS